MPMVGITQDATNSNGTTSVSPQFSTDEVKFDLNLMTVIDSVADIILMEDHKAL